MGAHYSRVGIACQGIKFNRFRCLDRLRPLRCGLSGGAGRGAVSRAGARFFGGRSPDWKGQAREGASLPSGAGWKPRGVRRDTARPMSCEAADVVRWPRCYA